MFLATGDFFQLALVQILNVPTLSNTGKQQCGNATQCGNRLPCFYPPGILISSGTSQVDASLMPNALNSRASPGKEANLLSAGK